MEDYTTQNAPGRLIVQVSFDSCILFTNKIQNKEVLDFMGQDYFILTMQTTLNEDEYCSESILASKNT